MDSTESSPEFVRSEVARYDYDRSAQFARGPGRVLEESRKRMLKHPVRESYIGWLNAVRATRSQNPQRILDYCAGDGRHTVTLQTDFPETEVIAIDISAKSLEFGAAAWEQGNAPHTAKKPTFLQMDAHHLSFPDNHFDLIADSGSLSSLEFDQAIKEVERVLRPGGAFIALETFGHNPIANIKRKLNYLREKRTKWSASHIFDEIPAAIASCPIPR